VIQICIFCQQTPEEVKAKNGLAAFPDASFFDNRREVMNEESGFVGILRAV
jgi:hypothetical protein